MHSVTVRYKKANCQVHRYNKGVKNVYLLDKPVGISPLQAIQYLKTVHPDLSSVPLGYAGRLDPMASGLLLVLAGDENRKRKDYERLEKTYEFEILFGFETDTYDVLGLIQNRTNVPIEKIDLRKTLDFFSGTFVQPYPPYSSPRVNGKPLYYWARSNRLSEVAIPEKKVLVQQIALESLHEISFHEIQTRIIDNLTALSPAAGDFRQQFILEQWREEKSAEQYRIARCRVRCSSGLYVRSLCNEIGKRLESSALALSIRRTEIGPYTISSDGVIPVPGLLPGNDNHEHTENSD